MTVTKTIAEIKKTAGVVILDERKNRICGWLYARHRKRIFFTAKWNDNWEQVYISRVSNRPKWDELCETKEIFWNDDECVIQYIPSESMHKDKYNNCLYLWKSVSVEIPIPPETLI
ncbi:MAG: hypothetical protein K2H28_01515 [Ruminococcus sp.]|nr:hypothetical protein [Ruminococcus sp.]